LYRLIDEYSIFYLNFIKHNLKYSDGIWLKLSQTPKYKSWAGFAFEGICLKHLNKIKGALGISGIYSESSGYISQGADEKDGFQIDMIIDRSDNAINLCEMKFFQSKITLTKKDGEQLTRRRERFRTETGTNKYLFTTLITTFGLHANQHSIGLIDHVITMDQLF
ncbi:MAG: ATP-binding protein, partial [Saprospiraceae bacterium]|nr:ATP-binding protein [Saprospiraceae bacterium]